jgi:hypothetical protein
MPNTNYENAAINTVGMPTTTSVNSSGRPVKDRGIYFNGIDAGRIDLANLILDNVFTVQAWVLHSDTLGDATIFSKDRSVFESAGDQNHLRLSVTVTGNLGIEMAKATDTSSYELKKSDDTAKLAVKEWAYVTWQVK